MQRTTWLKLLRTIPDTQHDNLLAITTNGTELAIKGLVRMEEEYLIVRGRVTGVTEEGGGIYFLPLANIEYLGFQRPVKEPELISWFGGTEAAKADASKAAAAREEPPPETITPPPPAPGQQLPGVAAKAALLERLRARRAGTPAKPET